MKHFDHIVFDVDGTLADTEESVLSSLGQIIQEETGKTLPRHELEFALGIPGKDALEKLGIYSQATLDRWCQVAASFKSTISMAGRNTCAATNCSSIPSLRCSSPSSAPMNMSTALSTLSATPLAPVPSATARFGSSRSRKLSASVPANTAPPRCRIDRLPSATLKCCNEAQDLHCGWADYGSQ